MEGNCLLIILPVILHGTRSYKRTKDVVTRCVFENPKTPNALGSLSAPQAPSCDRERGSTSKGKAGIWTGEGKWRKKKGGKGKGKGASPYPYLTSGYGPDTPYTQTVWCRQPVFCKIINSIAVCKTVQFNGNGGSKTLTELVFLVLFTFLLLLIFHCKHHHHHCHHSAMLLLMTKLWTCVNEFSNHI